MADHEYPWRVVPQERNGEHVVFVALALDEGLVAALDPGSAIALGYRLVQVGKQVQRDRAERRAHDARARAAEALDP